MSDVYPRERSEKKYFAHRFCRFLTKSAAAQELGPDVCWMLTVIAHQEDAKHYTGAVTYWNEQLMPLCGFGSKRRLVQAREKAVATGWLHYEQGGRTAPGRYWCKIPKAYQQLPDGPCDETGLPFQNETQSGTANDDSEHLAVSNRNAKRNDNRTQSETASGPLSTLPLNPNTGTGANGSVKGTFSEITNDRLKDIDFMQRWYAKASRKKPPLVPAGDTWLVNTVAVAVRAVEQGDNPSAVFVSIVQRGLWDHITPEQTELARRRLREYDRRHAHAADPGIAELADRKAAPSKPLEDDDEPIC